MVERRFLPAMTVAHALPLAEEGGLAGRPGVTRAGAAGVFLAGDWVGPRGMLADAAAASAEEAAGACSPPSIGCRSARIGVSSHAAS